jgi:hypothetical protein
MRRFIITVIVGSVIYTGLSVLTQIENPGDDSLGVIFAPIVGIIFSAVIVVVFLLPLGAGLRHFFPSRTQRTHAIIAASILLALVTVFSLMGTDSTFPMGRINFWASWLGYSLALVASIFWPLSARVVNRGEENMNK